MLVHVLADTHARLQEVLRIVDAPYTVLPGLLGDPAPPGGAESRAIIIAVDLRLIDNITHLRKRLDGLQAVRKRIFLLESRAHLTNAQAYALGATLVLDAAQAAGPLRAAIDAHLGVASEAWRSAAGSAMAEGAGAFVAAFAAIAAGDPLDIAATRSAGSRIAEHVAEFGLSDWLSLVRRHHEGTYQHCLLVTGIAVDFGLRLGLGSRDLERLHTAAMFHDVGKAIIPLEILDKPGPLSEAERAIVETHAVAGYEVLKNQAGVSAEVLDVVLRHHEHLDGSGYPDGLSGDRIPDAVRMLTIADVFAALIEHRSYKPAMSRPDAYAVLCDMQRQGKIERALLVAFKDVALNR